MVAKVPKQAVGFTIETSRAEVVDLGTEFGVAIGPRDETLVQVFDGEVVTEFKQAGSNDNQRRHLRAGSAIQIESGEGTANVRELSFAKDRFVRQLPKLGHDAYTWLPPYNANHHEELHIVPADSEVVIDGDLADWNQSRKFVTHLREPYGKDYYVEGMMMYDRHNVYIGAHIGDPAPMRSVVGPELEPELFWKGGGLQVRLSTDPALGWPLDARSSISRDRSNPEAGSRPKDNSPNIVHMTMWFYRPAAQPCLALQYGMNFEPLVINPQGWQGAFREDPDGRGYRLEYAIPWSLLHDSARAPRPGDELGVCWQVHWSDDGGRMWRGHLVELTRPGVDGLAFLRADMWGRAIYHAALDPPPRDKALKTQPE